MIVLLIIWNLILTIMFLGLGLMFLGKVRLDARDKAALIHGVNAELEAGKKWMDLLSERIDKLLEIQQNLLTKVKTLEENPSEVSEQIEQLENRFSDLTENLENIRGDVNLFLSADKEHPVLAPTNKGGRPRKEGL